MNKSTKLTLTELMRRKEQILEAKKIKKTCELYIKSLDSTITIEEPTAALFRDATEMGAGDGDVYICYECIKEPNLKTHEIQEAFGCTEPMDIVNILFASGEIPQIAAECIKLAGYVDGVKAVKN